MKTIKKVALSAALVAMMSPAVSFAEGLEISGAVDTLFGWQHDISVPAGGAETACPGGAGASGCNSIYEAGSGGGQLGDLRGVRTNSRDTFNFYVDQVELDLSKTLGENVRIRADLDFRGPNSGGGAGSAGSFNLEQAYVTANIPVGNGLELLVGRFNIPMGIESVDRHNNIAVSFSNIYRFLRPHNVTGAKLYYAFNDMIDLNLYVVNNLQDRVSTGTTVAGGADSAIPGGGLRLGFNWGEEGKESTLGLSGAISPEVGNHNSHYTMIGDLDLDWAITENFTLAAEFIYRQDNVVVAGTNNKAMAATILAAYNFNESWGGYVRGGWLHDINPAAVYTGNDEQIIDWSAGFSYEIADGAKVKLEYRGDLFWYPTGTAKSTSHGAAAEFAYHF